MTRTNRLSVSQALAIIATVGMLMLGASILLGHHAAVSSEGGTRTCGKQCEPTDQNVIAECDGEKDYPRDTWFLLDTWVCCTHNTVNGEYRRHEFRVGKVECSYYRKEIHPPMSAETYTPAVSTESFTPSCSVQCEPIDKHVFTLSKDIESLQLWKAWLCKLHKIVNIEYQLPAPEQEIDGVHLMIHASINHEGSDEYQILPQEEGKLAKLDTDKKDRRTAIVHVSVRKDLVSQVPESPEGGWSAAFKNLDDEDTPPQPTEDSD